MVEPTRLPGGLALPFTKGHGTENAFVVVDDYDCAATLTPEWVRRVCDMRAGIGSDGLMRAVRAEAFADPDSQAAARAGATWYMDYWNADGSDAEMCGNGIRVFVRHLLHRGLISLADGESVPIGTRSGVRDVRREGDELAVWMGPWRAPHGQEAIARGHDTKVTARGDVPREGLSIVVPNPHVVVELPDDGSLERLDLEVAPQLDPFPPEGANTEFVVRLADEAPGLGHLHLRVFERGGAGETRSCGTGVAASAVAQTLRAAADGGRQGRGGSVPREWLVDVTGGRLTVRISDDEIVELQGPAVIVAEGVLSGLLL